MTQAYLSIQGVNKTFGSFSALNNIHIDIQKNEFICLLGPSGCGKTTLLRIIAGLEKPTQGQITVDGKDITQLPPAKRNFGMVFQSYALFPNLTAYQNVAYGLQGKKLKKKEIDEKVKEVLNLVDLLHLHDRYPAQMSGGQQQRVALARAIVLSPDFLLLDEPLSALDAKVRVKLREQICELQDKLGITTVMVTHDQEEALTMADRIVVMKNSEVVQMGTPEQVYEAPNSAFVADFIGSINFLENGEQGSLAQRTSLAIRPEHIRLSASGASKGVKAVVKHVEFRGAFYRVTLQLAAGSSYQNVLLAVDVSSQAAHQLRLAKHSEVFVEFPQEKMITFPADSMVGA
ncbi:MULTISPECIES: putative 2-aminoethylphosphonate ABC transporter ATP-binding protein [Paenibacillus]|uniref:2-aminoethylphosphonate ABC transporter ATP-binding protein n=1 Tax=Paenibacillus violae TaxID=3077234 RepID=A0ABU3RLW6_9BACL|nr:MULTISPECIES: putative 2-aminoethylphosphonate ABC transporter ATP-binding protein [Paenibacillus]MDU0205192.1 putative 2-aminoethylphosphonate ABC transporter ATP-binding protein [Paenibacillus sp. PFR10]MEC0268677.1 putative 2-aminoethylphosphonate ABC transporter ATP-binding protein [Paenibacillus anseongense]